jgi:hypothetical protein
VFPFVCLAIRDKSVSVISIPGDVMFGVIAIKLEDY